MAVKAFYTPEQAVAFVKKHGGIRAASRAEGMPYTTLQLAYQRAVRAGLAQPLARSKNVQRNDKEADKPEILIRGQLRATGLSARKTPSKGKVHRYILTCAQNNTHLHENAWRNLLELARYYGAEIMVSRFTYDKSSFGPKSVKPGTADLDGEGLWYDPQIEPYLMDERVELAPGLVFCGEMNILPTAARPLSGFEAYTGRKSGIFPHVKLAMDSIPSGKFEPTKFNYTTGTVTQRNYIQKKAGLKAEFHHCYGALLVEVDSDGDWFVRQLNADSEGTIYDLDVRVHDGAITDGNRVEGITWGDIHADTLEPQMQELLWGRGGVVDALMPKHQFMHDLLDFRTRNHHDRGNPHKMFAKHVDGRERVSDEIGRAAVFLRDTARPFCHTVVVDSNHDNALERWLREADYRHDPVNAVYFLEAQLAKYTALAAGDKNFHLVEWAMRRRAECPKDVRFLREDESFIICPDAHNGIECGMHGHLGPNGTRGSVNTFARMGRKANVGHSHQAGIHDGIYVSGITGMLEQGYNRGPSSWSQSFVVTYPNSKRAVFTVWNWKWRA